MNHRFHQIDIECDFIASFQLSDERCARNESDEFHNIVSDIHGRNITDNTIGRIGSMTSSNDLVILSAGITQIDQMSNQANASADENSVSFPSNSVADLIRISSRDNRE